jgi:mRNA interferase MazF
MPSAIFDRFDVVVVPFPFSDKAGRKRRPALVLSNRDFNTTGHTVLAMITTKGHHPWPGDCEITGLEAAGLPLPCIVRLKLFTLDNRLIRRRIGELSEADEARVRRSLGTFFG